MFDDLDKHVSNLWTMLAISARYGHQQLSESKAMTVEELNMFNKSLAGLIKTENETKRGITNNIAEGGG
jgi:hypothetical protein